MRRTMRCALVWPVLALGLAAVLITPLAWADTPAGVPPAPPAAPVPPVARAWPVGVRPPVLRGWEPPVTVYGPGHRGVDLGAPAGAPVRAIAPGRVLFAGRVAGRGVVSVEVRGTDLRTTYEPVRASVRKGEEVGAGAVVGVVEPAGSHCGTRTCVHWGLLRGDAYVNPLSVLPPWLLDGGPSRLLPVASQRGHAMTVGPAAPGPRGG